MKVVLERCYTHETDVSHRWVPLRFEDKETAGPDAVRALGGHGWVIPGKEEIHQGSTVVISFSLTGIDAKPLAEAYVAGLVPEGKLRPIRMTLEWDDDGEDKTDEGCS